MIRALALALTLLPGAALACVELRPDTFVCTQGTAWENAVWDHYGDGSDLVLGEVLANPRFDYFGRDTGTPADDLGQQFAMLKDLSDVASTLATDSLSLPNLTAERMIALSSIDDDAYMDTLMIVSMGSTRFAVFQRGPAQMGPQNARRLSEAFLTTLSPTCTDCPVD